MKLILPGLLLLALHACTFKRKPVENQVPEGHQELYSMPEAPVETKEESGLKRIVLLGTNDVRGTYRPAVVEPSDRHPGEKSPFLIGGVDVASAYFKIIRRKFENVVLLDAGNVLPEDLGDLTQVKKYLNFLKYDAFTLGVDDFNLKIPASVGKSSKVFQELAGAVHPALLVGNLHELRTGRLVEWKGVKPYTVKEVGGLKVGIIGLIPDDIVKMTPTDNRLGLYVESMLQSTLRNARLLRTLGADIIVVITHDSLECGKAQAEATKLPLAKVNFEPRQEGVCEFQGALGKFLERLPPNLVDVVFGGRHLRKMANVVNDIVVLSAFGNGKAFSFAELFWDPTTKSLVKEKTVVHQPVMLCRQFFKETSDCYTDDPSVNHRARIPATFMGEPIIPDPDAHKLFPDLVALPVKSTSVHLDVPGTLKLLDADIAFIHDDHSRHTHLVILEMTGAELARNLEQHYNEGSARHWVPSPRDEEQKELEFLIGAEKLRTSQRYRVLTDISSLRASLLMRRYIRSLSTLSLNTLSWDSVVREVDTVRSQLAAQRR